MQCDLGIVFVILMVIAAAFVFAGINDRSNVERALALLDRYKNVTTAAKACGYDKLISASSGKFINAGSFKDYKNTKEYTSKLKGAKNGGFDWAADGSSSQVQNNKCSELIATYGVTPIRDEAGHALYFTYFADDGEHTVWYADDETIEAWKNVIKSRGHENFSLWRLP